MNNAIEKLEERLQKLEELRSKRKAWLNKLITPLEACISTSEKICHKKNVHVATNIIRFPIEKRLANRSNLIEK